MLSAFTTVLIFNWPFSQNREDGFPVVPESVLTCAIEVEYSDPLPFKEASANARLQILGPIQTEALADIMRRLDRVRAHYGGCAGNGPTGAYFSTFDALDPGGVGLPLDQRAGVYTGFQHVKLELAFLENDRIRLQRQLQDVDFHETPHSLKYPRRYSLETLVDSETYPARVQDPNGCGTKLDVHRWQGLTLYADYTDARLIGVRLTKGVYLLQESLYSEDWLGEPECSLEGDLEKHTLSLEKGRAVFRATVQLDPEGEAPPELASFCMEEFEPGVLDGHWALKEEGQTCE